MGMNKSDESVSEGFRKSGRADLVMSRVPEPTLKLFKQFAKDQFCNDYGMALKYLVDSTLGGIPNMLEDHEKRLREMENKKEQDEKKFTRTNSGKKILKRR